jgi:hypothetical protein
MSNSLTRAQRRRIQRHTGKEKSDEVIDTLKKAIIDQTVDLYSLAIAHIMAHKLNYGGKKINMTLKQLEDLFEKINNDEIDFEDIRKDMLDNYDVAISKDTIHKIGGTK